MAAVPGAALALARPNIFDALAHVGDNALLTASELAALAFPGESIDLTFLERLLRMMVEKKILREVVITDENNTVSEGRFAVEPLGRLLVDDAAHGSFVHLLDVMHSPEFLLSVDHLHESVLDPSIQPFERAHGMPAWEYMKQHPALREMLNKTMAGFSKAIMPASLDVYDRGFDEVQVLVDVAGGVGAALGFITARYPHMRGINFDMPHVIAVPPQLPGGDAIFLKFILHSWEDKRCLTILKNCYQALPAHGKVIAVDNMLPEIIDFEGGNPLALQIDIHMMAWTDAGGRERTERDTRELGLAAGFNQAKVICKVDAMAVTEFRKLA